MLERVDSPRGEFGSTTSGSDIEPLTDDVDAVCETQRSQVRLPATRNWRKRAGSTDLVAMQQRYNSPRGELSVAPRRPFAVIRHRGHPRVAVRRGEQEHSPRGEFRSTTRVVPRASVYQRLTRPGASARGIRCALGPEISNLAQVLRQDDLWGRPLGTTIRSRRAAVFRLAPGRVDCAVSRAPALCRDHTRGEPRSMTSSRTSRIGAVTTPMCCSRHSCSGVSN